MSDDTKQQPTPADLARELIRLDDAKESAKPERRGATFDEKEYARATCGLIFHREAHARTIAEALLAAEGYIATLEFANEGHKAHVESVEQRLAAAEARVAEFEAAMEDLIEGIYAPLYGDDSIWDNIRKPLKDCRAALAKGKGATP